MFQINWKLKALLYKLFSVFNFKKIFYFSQKYITKRSKINITEVDKSWKFHVRSIQKNNVKKILEVGAGKSLSQNLYISYVLNNSVQQVVIDINEMIDFELLNQANDQISTMLKLKKKTYVKNLDQLKEVYRIDYRAPLKLENLNEEKFDMCISTTALEHFTLEDIKDYLNKLKKILSKNAIISSAIDYSDHYSHTDQRISKLNFLSFSEAQWRKYNNLFLFQNRLRHQDYKKIFEESGYHIVEVVLGPTLQPPRLVSKEFDSSNNKTFIGWAYFLIKEKFD